MPISLPAGLPARQTLLAEGIDVLNYHQLRSWGRRPLRICFVNLMPNKPATEVQFGRLLGASPMPVELSLCLPEGYRSKSASAEHLAFYRPWAELRGERFDGLIITGAPVETLPFEAVDYWLGLQAILDGARGGILDSLYICWAAQAALYHFHGVPKHRLERKMFGVFAHGLLDRRSALARGLADEFAVPVSRHTEVRAADLPAGRGLQVVASSPEAGLCLVEDTANRAVHMFNHLEYDAGTLREEYLRDRLAGKPTEMPRNYFPENDARLAPANTWRPSGHLLLGNWLERIALRANPPISDEPLVQWALAERRGPDRDEGQYSDLLIACRDGSDVLPPVLRTLADAGVSARVLKTHRQIGAGTMIELRIERLTAPALERLARHLCAVPGVSRVAFNGAVGSGGWLVAPHGAEPTAVISKAPTKAA